MVRAKEHAEGPCPLRRVVLEDAAEDLEHEIQGFWPFGLLSWNEAKNAGDEGAPREGLPFRSVEHVSFSKSPERSRERSAPWGLSGRRREQMRRGDIRANGFLV